MCIRPEIGYWRTDRRNQEKKFSEAPGEGEHAQGDLLKEGNGLTSGKGGKAKGGPLSPTPCFGKDRTVRGLSKMSNERKKKAPGLGSRPRREERSVGLGIRRGEKEGARGQTFWNRGSLAWLRTVGKARGLETEWAGSSRNIERRRGGM